MLAKAQDLIIEDSGSGALIGEVVESAVEALGRAFYLMGRWSSLIQERHKASHCHARTGDERRQASRTPHAYSPVHGYRVIIDATTKERSMNVHWQAKGPVVTPPKKKGFGTLLLKRAVATTPVSQAEIFSARSSVAPGQGMACPG